MVGSMPIGQLESWARECTPREAEYARLRAAGASQGAAYMRAYGHEAKGRSSAMRKRGLELERRPQVRAKMQVLADAADANLVLDMRQRRELLADTARRKIKGAPTHGDRIAAVREDAILAGERRTDGTQLTIGGEINIALVLQSLREGGAGKELPGGDVVDAVEVRDGEAESRLPHKHQSVGSNPTPASNEGVEVVWGPLGPLRIGGEVITRPKRETTPEAAPGPAAEVWGDE